MLEPVKNEGREVVEFAEIKSKLLWGEIDQSPVWKKQIKSNSNLEEVSHISHKYQQLQIRDRGGSRLK